MRKILAIAFILSFGLITYAANSPIIYKTVSGTLCAYNLITSACIGGGAVGTAGAVQYTTGSALTGDTTKIYFDATNSRLLINDPSVATPTQAKLIVSGPTNHYAAFFRSVAGGTEGGFLMGTYAAGGGFIRGASADNSLSQALYLQDVPADLVLSTSGGNIKLVSRTSCTALTTNGSDVLGCTTSDERLKKDIVPFERGLEAIEGLTPKSFKFKDPADMNIEHSAFIAQNVASVIPEAVRLDANGYMNLDYWTIIAAQANAIKELSARVKALEKAGPVAFVSAKKAIPMKPLWQAPKRPPPPKLGK